MPEINGLRDIPILQVGEEFTVPEDTTIMANGVYVPVEEEPDNELLNRPLDLTMSPIRQTDLTKYMLVNYILFLNKNLNIISNTPKYIKVLKKVMDTSNRRELNKQDLITGVGKSKGAIKSAEIRENIYKILLKLATDYNGKWGIINIISSHSARSSEGGDSPHAAGRAVDIVGCDMQGLPHPKETDKLKTFVMSNIYPNKREYACVSCLWGNGVKNHNENNSEIYSGMHMHLAVK